MKEQHDYDVDFPPDLIAQHPVSHRADARLLVVDRRQETIDHYHVRDLPDLLAAGDCLVLNDSRVVPARLVGYRTATGGRWEGLFLESDPNHCWRVLAKTRGKMATEESVTLLDRLGDDAVELVLIQREESGQWLMRVKSDESALALLERVGRIPLPHYIRGGEALPGDTERYQTVYARRPGSVAAPTAGLHFTGDLLQRLTERQISQAMVTLHVGLATFRPITAQRIEQHPMHQEWYEISESAAQHMNHCRSSGGRIVAVGSTSVRALESAVSDSTVSDSTVSDSTVLVGKVRAGSGQTDLFIRPPYSFRAVDALMTNFHLPRTSLLVMVRCFGGDQLIQRAYQEAIDHGYRFYSYGDSMLIL
jgi:S-adenosylmethionine:tRNA ribosyltransferase-isomerase